VSHHYSASSPPQRCRTVSHNQRQQPCLNATVRLAFPSSSFSSSSFICFLSLLFCYWSVKLIIIHSPLFLDQTSASPNQNG
jgi:hypothetical protein